MVQSKTPVQNTKMCSKTNLTLILTITLLRIRTVNMESSTSKQDETGPAVQHGDFIFGALFSVHHQPKQKRSATNNVLKCGEVREMYGIQRIEVTFQTIDTINRDPNILPNISLGVEIRDSCWYAPIALQQSIELIRDSISPNSQSNLESCSSETQVDVDGEPDKSRIKSPLIGVIGPGSSSVALQVQNLLQLFHIPQIGYSATSKDLSDKSRFNYFLRVVPSDYYQAQVMVDIVRNFNWTYVSAVNTDENYGQSGIQAFRELAKMADVCIAREDSVLSNADDADFDNVILNLLKAETARVVVCFCEGMTVRGLLKATQRLNLTGRFLFIGSDGWADRADVIESYESVAHGSISIRIHSPYVDVFDDYYFKLRPSTNKRNPWFNEFWQARFSCKLPDESTHHGNVTDSSAAVGTRPSTFDAHYDEFWADASTEPALETWTEGASTTTTVENKRICTGNEKLSEKYKQDPKLSFVVKAIYTLAYGLQSMQQDLCGRSTVGLCPKMYPFNGSLFKSYLMNVSFPYGDGDAVEFDNRGDPPGRYDIMNYQLINGTYDYVQVGDWNNGTLSFKEQLQYGPEPGERESVCSKPCKPGQYKNFQQGGQDKRCCWTCVPCRAHEILEDETTCKECEPGFWPDENLIQCNQIPVEFVTWSDGQAIVAMIFSCLGFLTTAFGCTVFVRFNDTPVVKSSTRELSYLILAGMTLSHAATFPILAKPSELSCSLSRTLPGISFAMIYASLLTKTNRIARILAGSKKRFPTRKPRFMSATSQVLITCFLIGLEVGFSVTMLVYQPAAPTFQYPAKDRVMLVCNTTPIGVVAPLAFDFLLIFLCTVYALKTRNVPENFNEAKFIGFAMYTTCVIWIAFVPIYFGSETKIITMCMCVTLSAMVTFVFLFMPKLYIILLRPERNNRALFTTSKTIRCHIGSRVASAVTDKSSFSSSGYRDSSLWKAEPESNSSDTASKLHVNWKDRAVKTKNDSKQPEKRTLSCQTGNELLQILIQAHLMSLNELNSSSNNVENDLKKSSKNDEIDTKKSPNYVENDSKKSDQQLVELNARALMNNYNYSSPASVRQRRGSRSKKHNFPGPKTRIREENASDGSLSDNDSCQLKNITISFGSVTSVHSQNCANKSNGKTVGCDETKVNSDLWTNSRKSPSHSMV